MQTGMLAAAKGGFTGVLTMPSTLPAIDTKSQVEYIQKISAGNVVNIHPAGSITKNLKGKELTEMYDMHRSGALAFTDDKIAFNMLVL